MSWSGIVMDWDMGQILAHVMEPAVAVFDSLCIVCGLWPCCPQRKQALITLFLFLCGLAGGLVVPLCFPC